MKNKKVIKKEFEKHIHLHGYQEIKDFFKDEYEGHEKELEDLVIIYILIATLNI